MKKRIAQGIAAVVLALVRAAGEYRIWRVFHALLERDRLRITELLKYVLNAEMPDRLLQDRWLLNYAGSASVARSAYLDLSPNAESAALMDQIPSETSARERRFLWRFFASVWSGEGDVVEVGPFLGGTSRAIALGMRANPNYRQGRLVTFDRFEQYYQPGELKSFVDPLVRKGLLSEANVTQLGDASSFLAIFREIHQQHDYGRIIEPVARPLPDTPAEAAQPHDWFHVPDDTACSAYFVDGCKSWYGTKYFMKDCSRTAHCGSWFIFQDYLQYTCFWLPAFIAAFDECFRLVAHVDQTYAFQLVCDLPADRIEAEFPDDVESLARPALDALFASVGQTAVVRGDNEAILKHRMQHAAALAYIGAKDEARAAFARLSRDPIGEEYRGALEQASRKPTYRPGPGGVVTL